MRLILVDRPTEKRSHFDPLGLSRPIWELRCGMTSLGEKLVDKLQAADVACFVPPYMAEVYRAATRRWGVCSDAIPAHGGGGYVRMPYPPTAPVPGRPVNEPASLAGDDLLVVAARVKAAELSVAPVGPSQIALDCDGEVLYARIAQADLARLDTRSIDSLLESAKRALPVAEGHVPTWEYTWELVLANPQQLKADFAAAGRSGIEGRVEEPRAIRGSLRDVYVAPGALVHPLVVLDASEGPIYIDQDAVIHPFTRIEGPCYIGKKSILFGAKCREGNSIGPACRIGGEVEESIIHGYSNKYHDGFLGHAYVGQWVNLGAMTTNSDLKNDYSNVSVILDGRCPVDTGSTKVGALIGDHTKTSIGTLFNTGAYVGAMALIATTGKLLPKFIPSFAWLLEGAVTKGFGRQKLYETAKVALERRGCRWTPADEAMWNEIYDITKPARDEAIQKGRRLLAASHRE